jgi:steroid 5-alpha reductase family enzyme
VNIALWLLSLRLGKAWPVDFIWSAWPIAHALLLVEPGWTGRWRQVLALGIIVVWGARLTANFVRRGGIGHEDWRYAEQRVAVGASLGAAHWWWVSLFSVFLGQSLFMFTGCLSLHTIFCGHGGEGAGGGGGGGVGGGAPWPLSILGLGVACAAVVLEAAADAQLDAFVVQQRAHRKQQLLQQNQQRGENAVALPAVLSTGLWGVSRHPNYLGEWSFWFGLWLMGGAQLRSYSTLGPVLLLLLFLFVSIDLMETRQLKRRGEAYQKYQRQVPRFFPRLLPRGKARST